MGDKYTEAFDSLKSDDDVKRRRAERVLSAHGDEDEVTVGTGGASAAKARRRIFSGKRGVALIMAIVMFVAAAITIPVVVTNSRGRLIKALSLLNGTHVDMDGVAAFGVWNAPDPKSGSARISNVSYVRTAAALADKRSAVPLDDGTAGDSEDGGIITGDWSDEERYEWESDYDWDPTKANVLIAIGDDGKISEVVYERTNGRGQVRQDRIGNAAAVYVSDGFTYVMYVDDDEWRFWKEINFAQEMCSFSGFHCHHEQMQTVVIHNATGKVFALKDIIPQVNALSGATNYTMQVFPFKEDYLYLMPLYGRRVPQWYTVIYDEKTEKIRYELMLPEEVAQSYGWEYYVRAARRDKYGQQYLLEGYNNYNASRLGAGTVNIPSYTRYGNSLVLSAQNGIMYGADGRVYAFDKGKLKVFGENFELGPVEAGLEVTFEGVANEFFDYGRSGNEGIVYRLKGGYLYSMFGEVWRVDDDGTMHEYGKLNGSFPRYADDGYMMGGEIIAYVDTGLTADGQYSINGRMVRIKFDCAGGEPSAVVEHIIAASELHAWNHRIVVEQNENPLSSKRGETKHFRLTVQNGTPVVEYFAYGRDGRVYGLVKPATEPLTVE